MARNARSVVRILAVALALAAPAAAEDLPDAERICSLIERAADRHGVPKPFFARLIYRESRFDARAISPVGAEGVAQFMPATAKARGLKNPWEPAQAIPHSAYLLADLRRAFGNWGLAAAAYNGGPGRVEAFLARGTPLPLETRANVRAITGRAVEWFRARGREVEARPLDTAKDFATACRELPVKPTRATLVARSPWGVQVAGGRSRGIALSLANRVKARHSEIVGGRPVMVLRSRRGARGTPWQARIGAESRKDAGLVCARLKRAGAPCVVLRN